MADAIRNAVMVIDVWLFLSSHMKKGKFFMSQDSTVHFIAHFTVNNKDGYRLYEKGFFPILKAHGGEFVTYDDGAKVLEGAREAGRTVIIKFESEEACLKWWNSAEYIELAKFRIAATTTHSISIVHPIPPRP